MQGQLPNQRLGKKYLLGELLGRGGFGEVYKAQNLLLNRPQAIKVILENHLSDPKFRERFLREAQTLAALNHPNILHVDDFEIEQERAYLVMPFIEGGTLHSILVKTGPLGLEVVEQYLKQICAAVDYAHARHVVHLDLKPRNLLHQDGTLLLSDFGLAHLMKEGAVEGGTSLRFGSPAYMAPEQISGQPQAQSDIYALGIILYQMLTGWPPFEGSTPEAIMMKHLMEPPAPLRTKRPDLPSALGSVIEKALAKKPEERYATAGALLEDYQAALTATWEEKRDAHKREPSGETTIPEPGPLEDMLDQQDKDPSAGKERKAIQPVPRRWYKLGKRDGLAIGASGVVSAASLWLAIQVSTTSPLAPIVPYLVFFAPPFLVGIAVPALSKRKGVDALFPALVGGLASGCLALLVGSALGGPPPLLAVLLFPLGAMVLFLLAAATSIGIMKLWRRSYVIKT